MSEELKLVTTLNEFRNQLFKLQWGDAKVTLELDYPQYSAAFGLANQFYPYPLQHNGEAPTSFEFYGFNFKLKDNE